MLLSVSRLIFTWAKDGIVSKKLTYIHPQKNTPIVALIFSGAVSSVGVIGSNLAGDFFLGIDIMVTSMLVNFILMSITILTIKKYNSKLYFKIEIFKNRIMQLIIGWGGIISLGSFLVIHLYKDITKEVDAWYFHSTYVWLIVMVLASIIFILRWYKLAAGEKDFRNRFKKLPSE